MAPKVTVLLGAPMVVLPAVVARFQPLSVSWPSTVMALPVLRAKAVPGAGVAVAPTGVSVAVGVLVPVAVRVGVLVGPTGVLVRVGVRVGVSVGPTGVLVRVGVTVGVRVGVTVLTASAARLT